MLVSALVSLALVAPTVLAVPQNPASNRRGPRKARVVEDGKNLFTPTNYTIVDSIFVQSTPSFQPTGYNAFNDSLGLIDKSGDRWLKLAGRINQLNREADDKTSYKLIYIARHGEGTHNAAEAKVGKELWNCRVSLLDFYEGVELKDAQLTPLGISQAKEAKAAFEKEISEGMPMPKLLLSSPLRRAASTLQITWEDLLIKKGKVKPIFKENLRESVGLHTCDNRSDKGVLSSTYPDFDFEVPFTYYDNLYDSIYQENAQGQQPLRLQRFMNEVFAREKASVISITAHSGVINAFLKAVGHRPARTQTGGVVPVLIKAVGHPTATNTAIIGGPSNTAPACPASV